MSRTGDAAVRRRGTGLVIYGSLWPHRSLSFPTQQQAIITLLFTQHSAIWGPSAKLFIKARHTSQRERERQNLYFFMCQSYWDPTAVREILRFVYILWSRSLLFLANATSTCHLQFCWPALAVDQSILDCCSKCITPAPPRQLLLLPQMLLPLLTSPLLFLQQKLCQGF